MAEDSLLKVKVNGKLVAEAPLHIYDGAVAWEAFQNAYPDFAHLVAGEVYQAMRVACNPRLRGLLGEQGVVIELEAPELMATG